MNINEAIDLLKLLADESRLNIIKQLSKNKKLNGNELLKAVNCKQATLSHHMALLADAKLVKAKKKGNKVFYTLESETLARLANYLCKGEDIVISEPKKEEAPVQEVKKVEDPDIVRDVQEKVVEKRPEKKDMPTYLL